METVSLTEAIQFCILLVGIYASFILTVIVFKVKDHDDNFTRAMGNVQSALGQAYEEKEEVVREEGLRFVDSGKELVEERLRVKEVKRLTNKIGKGSLKLRDVKRSTDE